MSAEIRQPARRICVLAVGTRGDVQPLHLLASRLAEADKASLVAFVTHATHQEWLASSPNLCMHWLCQPPTLTWGAAQGNTSGGGSDNRTALRDELLHCSLAALGDSSDDLAPGLDGLLAVRRQSSAALQCTLVIFNLFALEGFHIAEALGCGCLVASPCVVPYSAPASYARRFAAALPNLYRCLQDSLPGQAGWADIEHWMWPLFTERWHSWRQQTLGLPRVPLLDAATRGEALPPPPPLLYGLPHLIIPRPAYWPSTVTLCGYWAETVATDWASAAVEAFLWQSKVVCIDLGSMPRLGFVPCAASFVAHLRSGLRFAGLQGILLTGGYQPLQAACMGKRCDAGSKGSQVSGEEEVLMALSHAPHNQLLPRCVAVIHHGGAGTTGAALRCGTPQIILPMQFDQFTWAEKVVDMGVGFSLPGAATLLQSTSIQPPPEQQPVFHSALSPLLQRVQQPNVVSRCKEMAAALACEPDGVTQAVRLIQHHLEAAAPQPQSPVAADEEQLRCKRLRLQVPEADTSSVAPSFCNQPKPAAESQRVHSATQFSSRPVNGSSHVSKTAVETGSHAAGDSVKPPPKMPPDALSKLSAGVPPVQRLRLSTQLEVLTSCPTEAQFLYDEIFVRRCYMQHGISVAAGDIIMDVGANIGMFTLFLLLALPEAEQPSRIIAVEPLQPNLRVLTGNLHLHQLQDRVTVVPFSADASSNSTMQFTYYPNMPGNSTAQPAEKTSLQAGLMLPARFAGQELYDVQTVTLSNLMHMHHLQRVDLLKIDVEGSELPVLHGITQECWSGIRRVVMEVHDVADRVDTILELLQGQGFSVTCNPGELANVVMVYATKSG